LGDASQESIFNVKTRARDEQRPAPRGRSKLAVGDYLGGWDKRTSESQTTDPHGDQIQEKGRKTGWVGEKKKQANSQKDENKSGNYKNKVALDQRKTTVRRRGNTKKAYVFAMEGRTSTEKLQ